MSDMQAPIRFSDCTTEEQTMIRAIQRHKCLTVRHTANVDLAKVYMYVQQQRGRYVKVRIKEQKRITARDVV